jgi:hypothetical protein
VTEIPIDTLYLSETALCIPRTAEFEAWIAGVAVFGVDEVPYCE